MSAPATLTKRFNAVRAFSLCGSIAAKVIAVLTGLLSLIWLLNWYGRSSWVAVYWFLSAMALMLVAILVGVVPNGVLLRRTGSVQSRKALTIAAICGLVLACQIILTISLARLGLWRTNPFF